MAIPYSPGISPEAPYSDEEPSTSSASNEEHKEPLGLHKTEPRYKSQPWENTGTHSIRVYKPTMEEMADFEAYINKIELDGGHRASGICKVIPPSEWMAKNRPKMLYNKVERIKLKKALKVNIVKARGVEGVYRQENTETDYSEENFTVRDFERLVNKNRQEPETLDIKSKEIEFWASLENERRCGLYGADVEDTLFPDDIDEWNINKVDKLLSQLTTDTDIAGVTSPYLYFGAPDTAFSWHVEDINLYSINYHHFGEPKFWYAIPSSSSGRFERLCHQLYRDELGGECKTFIRHKICIVHPKILKKHHIPFGCIPQYPGEFIVTFPRGYHMGFNLGFNCNEAINFATERWFPYGLIAKMCDCNPHSAVRLPIDAFYSSYMSSHTKPFGFKIPAKETTLLSDSIASLPLLTQLKYQERIEKVDLFRRNFKDEIQWNKMNSEIYPYCAVCQHFTSNSKVGSKLKASKSMVLSTPLAQRKFYGDKHKLISGELRQCAVCKLTVHHECSSRCDNHPFWLCDPCGKYVNDKDKTMDVERAYVCCEWCFVRGGALVQLIVCDGGTIVAESRKQKRFVHVVCAIANRFAWLGRTSDEILFACAYESPKEQPTLSPFQPVKHFGADRFKRHVEYLNHSTNFFIGNAKENHCSLCREALTDGTIVKCVVCSAQHVECNVYHPTCAKLCDYQLILRDFPEVLVALCPSHSSKASDGRKNLSCLRTGQLVYGQQLGEEFVEMEIIFKAPRDTLMVKFFDNSEAKVSNEDVVKCQCSEVGCERNHKLWYLLSVKPSPASEEPRWGYLVKKLHPFTYTIKSKCGKVFENVERETLYTYAEMGRLQRGEGDTSQNDSTTDEEDSNAELGSSDSSDDEFGPSPKKKKRKKPGHQKGKTKSSGAPTSRSVSQDEAKNTSIFPKVSQGLDVELQMKLMKILWCIKSQKFPPSEIVKYLAMNQDVLSQLSELLKVQELNNNVNKCIEKPKPAKIRTSKHHTKPNDTDTFDSSERPIHPLQRYQNFRIKVDPISQDIIDRMLQSGHIKHKDKRSSQG